MFKEQTVTFSVDSAVSKENLPLSRKRRGITITTRSNRGVISRVHPSEVQFHFHFHDNWLRLSTRCPITGNTTDNDRYSNNVHYIFIWKLFSYVNCCIRHTRYIITITGVVCSCTIVLRPLIRVSIIVIKKQDGRQIDKLRNLVCEVGE